MKNTELNTKLFLEYVLEIISNEYKGMSNEELESQVKSILGKRKTVLAKSFYRVAMLLNSDIDILCEHLFKNIEIEILYPIPKTDNKIKTFVSPFIIGTKKIASNLDAQESRLNRLISGQYKQLYPFEVYSLAKSFGLRPRQLFDYFYGNGKRPLVGA